MDCKQIFAKIDELNAEYIRVWEDVCNLESPTDHKAGVDAVGNYFASMAEKRGWDVEIFSQPVSGNVVSITLNPAAPGPMLALSAHLDTVHPLGSFGTPAVRRDEEKIYGPGVIDCKGGAVAAFLAMDALDQCGFRQSPVRLLLQTDEENGSRLSGKATIRHICEQAREAAAFLNLEPHASGEACLKRKGIITFLFSVHGAKAHACDCAVAGANAVAEAAHKILEIEKLKEDGGLTCCCSVIHGGTAANTVPDACEFLVNVRFADSTQEQWIQQYMREMAEKVFVPGCQSTVTIQSHRLAMEQSEKNEALLALLNRGFEKNGLPALKGASRKGGSDAADVTAFGIPCVDSLGVRGGGIHTSAEFAWLASLAESAKRVAAAAEAVGSQAEQRPM